MEDLLGCTGFDWDEGNTDKSWARHKVRWIECEEVFFNHPLLVLADDRHSGMEPRYFALGQTNAGRLLFVVFTVRESLVRVISARDMSKRERQEYADAEEEGT